MQLTQILNVLAFAPLLALANPVAVEYSSIVERSPLERRGGKYFCGRDLRAAGDPCIYGNAESEPHACGIKDRAVVVILSYI